MAAAVGAQPRLLYSMNHERKTDVHVKMLESVVYASDGWSHHSEKTTDPSWAQIESAIRRLNRFHYPAILLWPTEDEAAHAVDGEHECFEVMGGEGVYWLAGSIGSD